MPLELEHSQAFPKVPSGGTEAASENRWPLTTVTLVDVSEVTDSQCSHCQPRVEAQAHT